MALISFPLTSDFVKDNGGNVVLDEAGFPKLDRAVDGVYFRGREKRFWKNGIFGDPAAEFSVTPAGGLNVNVVLGAAFAEGVTVLPDDNVNEIKTLAAASPTADRTDRIVIRFDISGARITTIEVYAGWTNANALVRNGNMWELAIADVKVRRAATSVSASDITDLRLYSDLCGIVAEPLKRTNTTTFYNQLNANIANIKSQWDSLIASKDLAFQEQRNGYDAQWSILQNLVTAWMASSLEEFALLSPFNFDNMAALPGHTKKSVPDGDNLSIEIRRDSDNFLLAKKNVTAVSDTETVIKQTAYGAAGPIQNVSITITELSNGSMQTRTVFI
jgi:hypothetical protein